MSTRNSPDMKNDLNSMYCNLSLSDMFAHSLQTEGFLLMTASRGPPRTLLSTTRRTPRPTAWSTSTCSRPRKSHTGGPPWMFASINASLPRRRPDTCSPCLCPFLLRAAVRRSTGDPLWAWRVLCRLICWMNSTRCWARPVAVPRATTDGGEVRRRRRRRT